MNGTTQGFTLLELLIVIGIISIFAILLLPNLLTAQQRAYDTAALACAQAFWKGLQIHFIDHPNDQSLPSYADLITPEYGGEKCTENNGIVTRGGLTTFTKYDANNPNISKYNRGDYILGIKHRDGTREYYLGPKGVTLKPYFFPKDVNITVPVSN